MTDHVHHGIATAGAVLEERLRVCPLRIAVVSSERPERVFVEAARADRVALHHHVTPEPSRRREVVLRAAFALVDLTIVESEAEERAAIALGADPDRIARIDDGDLVERLSREPRRKSLPKGAAEAFASALLDAAELSGTLDLLERVTADGGINVVNYHRVLPLRELREYARPQMALGAPTFEAQLRAIAERHGFAPIESVDRPEAAGRVAITFDDGYEDNFRVALPILERFSAPACIFVVTRLIGLPEALWWDRVGLGLFAWWKNGRTTQLPDGFPERTYELAHLETFEEARARISEVISDLNEADDAARERASQLAVSLVGALELPRTMLSWEEIERMKAAGISFGAHTRNHVVLDELDRETAKAELFGSQEDLDQRLGPTPHPTAALPRGVLGPLAEEELRARFRSVMTTDAGVNRAGAGALMIKRRDGKMLTLAGRHHPAKLRLELTGVVDRLRSAFYRIVG
jgi:peptidoglycan/xylan/chitin deacetylase (PgdA/CDA1 family)